METPVRMRAQGSFNIEEEYNNTLRTQSNACFLSKKQQSDEEMGVLLDTHQDLIISPMLQNMMMHRRTSSEIELAMAGYFDASAEASEMCRQLLRDIKSTQSNYQSMDIFLASMSSDGSASTSAREPVVRSNPFCTMTRSNFRQIHDRYSSVLQSIRSSHSRVTRKLRMVKAIKKLSRTCVLMACGAAAAAAAIGAATHLLFFGLLVIGPAAVGLCPAALKRRLAARKRRCGRATTSSLVRLREQLDTAAKGTYVLGRDLDTVSHLVARLSDGIERENAMARRCEERAGERCPVPEMVMSHLRSSCSSSRRLADELEEHVCLCLATIHRARLLVIQEISKQPYECDLEI